MMRTKYLNIAAGFCVLLLSSSPGYCVDDFHHLVDVVYGYKDGMALVMDVYTPVEESNKAGIILVMAGGMTSDPTWSHDAGKRADVQNLLKEGYTVFAAAHSSQPRYTADESRTDIPRAVRFIRHNSKKFGIEPDRIGILGYSSGGHVSLMTAIAPWPQDQESEDPVDRESSKVQAAIAYYPSTDLLNFGQENTTILDHFHSVGYDLDAAFDFHRWNNASNRLERIDDPDEIRDYFHKNSSINYVSDDDPPILLIHGSEDKLVPIQQSELMLDRLEEYGVSCELFVVPGKGHGWQSPVENEYAKVTGWYNKFLL